MDVWNLRNPDLAGAFWEPKTAAPIPDDWFLPFWLNEYYLKSFLVALGVVLQWEGTSMSSQICTVFSHETWYGSNS